MTFQCIVVVEEVLLSGSTTAIANEAPFVFFTTMGIQLVGGVETLSAESALGVSFESTLVYCAWFIITELLMFPQLFCCEKLMFMGETMLVLHAEITERLLVFRIFWLLATYHNTR